MSGSPAASKQAQTFGDINIEGERNSLVINQTIVISPAVVQAQPFIDRSPYIGLRRFEEKDQFLFFGRDVLVAKLLQAVRDQRFTIVAGASGSGKSSIVRAGLIPQLNKRLSRVRMLTMVPDRDPFARLQAAFLQAGYDLEQVAPASAASHETLLSLCTTLRDPEEPWLIFIDQFEEIFTLCGNAERRRTFLDGLVHLIEQGPVEVKLVAAMRADFFDRFDLHPRLLELSQPPFFVTSPSEAELRQCIEQPAAQHGVTFEAGLVTEILNDLKGQPGALPLLQYTLDRLWAEDLPENDRTLNTENYRKLGGISGALKQRADDLYHNRAVDRQRTKREQRPAEQREAMRRVFLRLLDLSEQGENARAISNRIPLSELPADEQKLVAELADEKLLVTNRTATGQATVEVAHESLLSAWPQLTEWIAQAREAIFVRNRLRQDAVLWDHLRRSAQHADEDLWSGSRLASVLDLEARGEFAQLGGLSPLVQEFLAASRAQRELRAREAEEERERELRRIRRSRTRSRLLALAATVVAVLTGGLGVISLRLKHGADLARQKTDLALQRADLALIAQLEEQGRVELLAGDPAKAAVSLVKARELGSDTPSLRFLLAQALRHVERRVVTLTGHRGPITRVKFSKGGARILTVSQDHTIRVWESATGKELLKIDGSAAPPIRARFALKDDFIVSWNLDQSLKFWDAYHARQPLVSIPLSNGQEPILEYQEPYLFASSHKLRPSVYDLKRGALVSTLEAPGCDPASIRFDRDRTRLAARCKDGTLIIFAADTGKRLNVLHGHAGPLRAGADAMSFAGQTVWLETADGVAEKWNLETKTREQKPAAPQATEKSTLTADSTPGGGDVLARFATLTLSARGKQGVLRENQKTVALLDGHRDRLNCADFSPDGDRLATGSEDGTVRIWETFDIQQPVLRLHPDDGRERVPCHSFSGPYGPLRRLGVENRAGGVAAFPANFEIAALSREGRRLLTLSGQLCDIESGRLLLKLEQNRGLEIAAFSPTGEQLVTADKAYVVRIFQTDTGKPGKVLGAQPANVADVSFSPDGKQVLMASGESATLWDVASGQRLATLAGHVGLVQRALFAPDGTTILTVSNDRTVRLWERTPMGVAANPRVFAGHAGAVVTADFSSDSSRFLSAGYDGTAMIRETKTGRILSSLEGHTGPILVASFSPDGERVVTGSVDQSARLWDARKGRLLSAFPHSTWVVWAGFSVLGDRLLTLTAASNLTALEWDVSMESRDPGELVAVLRKQRIPWIVDPSLVVVDGSTLSDDLMPVSGALISSPKPVAPRPNATVRSCAEASAPGCYEESSRALRTGDIRHARWLLSESCKGGLARACLDLGQRMQEGEDSPKDEAQAARHYKRACELGASDGCERLATMYVEDRGVPRDESQASLFFKRACELSAGAACLEAGERWRDGKGVTADAAQAAALYGKACDKANDRACLRLGELYDQGPSSIQNAARAAETFGKACDRDNTDACQLLGNLYDHGRGVPRDELRAAKLFAKGCYRGLFFRSGGELRCKSLTGKKGGAPEVVPGTAEFRGPFPSSFISIVARHNNGSIRDCFALGGGPTRHSSDEKLVRVSFEIYPSGVVPKSDLAYSTYGDQNVERCLVSAVRRWQFPPVPGGIMKVTYDFRPTATE